MFLAGAVMVEVGVHKIYHGAITAVVGLHGYGRVRGPINYFGTATLLGLTGAVMGDIGLHNIFNGASITVFGCPGYGRNRAHEIFHGTSITVVGWHGYGQGRGLLDIARSQHCCGCLARL